MHRYLKVPLLHEKSGTRELLGVASLRVPVSLPIMASMLPTVS
jgi:hypothetical protein